MIRSLMESSTEPIASPPSDLPPELRGPPPPPRGGLLTLLRFMRRHRMLNAKYALLLVRLGAWKLRLRGRLRLDGIAFIGPGCHLEVGARTPCSSWAAGRGSATAARSAATRAGWRSGPRA